MKNMSPKESVNQLVKNVVKPAFKKAGFAIDGNVFRKNELGFVKIFNIQNSHFNNALSASFDMNGGLFFPLTYGWRFDWPLPGKPKIEHCQFEFRAADLTRRHQSHVVSSDTDIKQLEELVKTELKDIILWFESITKLDDCLSAEKQIYPPGKNCNFEVALTHAELGDLSRANEVFNIFIGNSIIKESELSKMTAEAKRRGIKV